MIPQEEPSSALGPGFPRWHARPAAGWINDPAGCAYVDGRYHVFFQYNPDAAVHHAIGWGHVSSSDLVHWREEPQAMRTRPGELDAYGCWTGCLTVDDGIPTLVYSGVVDSEGGSHVLLARGDRDLGQFTQLPQAAVGMPDSDEITDVRDPFVFTFNGRRYAIQGAGARGTGRPRVLLYEATDLTSWDELGDLLEPDNPVASAIAPADIWECPNLFQIKDRWILVLSLCWPSSDPAKSFLAGVRYLVGEMRADSAGHPRFTPHDGGQIDTGPSFYAPQVLVLEDRVLLWAWAWELHKDPTLVAEQGWAGVLTWVRQLGLAGDELTSRPIPELTQLRGPRRLLRSGDTLADRAFEVALPPGRGQLSLVTNDGREQHIAEWVVPEQPIGDPTLLVDGSLVELFPGTPTSHTTRAYPTTSCRWRVTLDRSDHATHHWPLGVSPADVHPLECS